MKLSERIKRLREQASLSQAQLAELVRVSRVAVTKWESGDTENIKLANLIALCKAFALSADELIGMEPTSAPYEAAREQSVRACEEDHAGTSNEYAKMTVRRGLPAELEAEYLSLTDAGQELVRMQLQVAVETAKRLHGTRPDSSQTAA